MDSESIVAALKRLGVNHDEIAEVIGRDRTAATKMLAGKRNVQVRELQPLAELIAKHERQNGDTTDPERGDYVEIEVLPTYAGAGGGGTGDADRQVALVRASLVHDELKAKPVDLLLIDVRGDSMEPDFYQGDQILIDKRDRDPRQPGPFALWDGDGYVIKLVERAAKKGWYRIFSANPRYRDYEVEEKDTTIMGRPVWFARRL